MTDLSHLPENTPVIVGVGLYQEHEDDPAQSLEAYQLMVQAVRLAAQDAGNPALLSLADSINVPQGTWGYQNPAALIAREIGADSAKTIFSSIGVMQLTLISDACEAISNGEQQIAIVTGGDAKYRALRSLITETPVSDSPDIGEADERIVSKDPMCADLETERGLMMPTEFFAIMESSLRRQQGLSVDAHRDEIAEMYSGFSKVAAQNPHAWKQEAVAMENIRNPNGKNVMLSFPYTKLHNTQWNVNQASAIIITSVKVARRLDIDNRKWVFPLAAAQSTDVVPMSQRQVIHSSNGTKASATKAFELAGCTPNNIKHIELYSCFPASVRSFAIDAGLGLNRPLTVTGGMPFAGGPLNNFTLQGVARMVEVLRNDPGSKGIVSALSGMIGKQSFALFSSEPNPAGYAFEDVTEQVAAGNPALDIVRDYQGEVTVAGYTVVYNKQGISHGIAVFDTPEGKRTLGQCFDKALLEQMTLDEYVGKTVWLDADGQFKAA